MILREWPRWKRGILRQQIVEFGIREIWDDSIKILDWITVSPAYEALWDFSPDLLCKEIVRKTNITKTIWTLF